MIRENTRDSGNKNLGNGAVRGGTGVELVVYRGNTEDETGIRTRMQLEVKIIYKNGGW